jgi:hypothetical protein
MDPDGFEWTRTTKAWYQHRVAAEIAWYTVIPAGILALAVALRERTGDDAPLVLQICTGAVVPLLWLFQFSRGNLRAGFHAARRPPRFVLGDTVEWRRPTRASEIRFWVFGYKSSSDTTSGCGYVNAVALDQMELIDPADIAAGAVYPTPLRPEADLFIGPGANLERPRRDVPCRSGCRGLHRTCERDPARSGVAEGNRPAATSVDVAATSVDVPPAADDRSEA